MGRSKTAESNSLALIWESFASLRFDTVRKVEKRRSPTRKKGMKIFLSEIEGSLEFLNIFILPTWALLNFSKAFWETKTPPQWGHLSRTRYSVVTSVL